MVKEMVKKIKETVKRDKAGRFKKGTGGGPGRKKGEPRDIICKDGKKRSVATLIDDLLAAYEHLGGDKFLKSWAAHSHRNLARFVEILFKFAPPPEASSVPGGVIYEFSEKYMPKIERIITDKRPGELKDDKNKRIKELENLLRKQDAELRRLRSLVDVQDIEEIEHEPILPKGLPEHSKIEEPSEDLASRGSKKESGKKIGYVTTGEIDVSKK